MKPRNLISVFQGDSAVESTGLDVDKRFVSLKKHEIRNMRSFCDLMQTARILAKSGVTYGSYLNIEIDKKERTVRIHSPRYKY